MQLPCPAPSVGSPLLVWHLGIQRRLEPEPNQSGGEELEIRPYLEKYQEHTDNFLSQISTLIEKIQKHGVEQGENVSTLETSFIPSEGEFTYSSGLDNQEKPFRFKTFAKQSLNFDIWWRDPNDGLKEEAELLGQGKVCQSPWNSFPPASAIRVHVQVQSFQDHVSISFYMDVSKPYGRDQILTANDVQKDFPNSRRAKIQHYIDIIRQSSLEQIKTGSVDTPAHHQPDSIMINENQLNEAAEQLYQEIWKDFSDSFGITETVWSEPNEKDPSYNNACAVFTSQRGIMMSIKGLEKKGIDQNDDRETIKKKLSDNNLSQEAEGALLKEGDWMPDHDGSTATLGPVELFDPKIGEPGTLLKSLWPFLVETYSYDKAIAHNWIGCGILDWRALLVLNIHSGACDSQCDTRGAKLIHQRFLVVTNGEPHREQIGRFIERFVALETMRLFALKNLGNIRNSHFYLRNLIRILDKTLKRWSDKRETIEGKYKDVRESWRKNRPLKRKELNREKQYFHELRVLSSENEESLIHIAAGLDTMAAFGSGQLAYNIDQAKYYLNEFLRMTPSLEIGNIDGWQNYSQFIDRSMQPTYNMIQTTGNRLEATQEQLKNQTRIVQTAVEIVQSHATQRNTDQLSKIASHFFWVKTGLWGGLLTFLFTLSSSILEFLDKIPGINGLFELFGGLW